MPMSPKRAPRIDEESLIEYLRRCTNPTWLDRYLDLIGEVLQVSDLGIDDPRLVCSLVDGEVYLPVSINYRYVLYAKRANYATTIICPYNLQTRRDLHLGSPWSFRQLAGERHTGAVPPIVVRIDSGQPIAEELREAWHTCLRAEVQRAKASPSRRAHNPFVAQAALDVAYRRQLVGFALRG